MSYLLTHTWLPLHHLLQPDNSLCVTLIRFFFQKKHKRHEIFLLQSYFHCCSLTEGGRYISVYILDVLVCGTSILASVWLRKFRKHTDRSGNMLPVLLDLSGEEDGFYFTSLDTPVSKALVYFNVIFSMSKF